MYRYGIALSLLMGSLSSPVVAGNGVNSRLQIHIPKGMFAEDGYDHREALFGIPPYGGSITQNVYYADSDLCDPHVDVHGGFPERNVLDDGKMAPWPSPYILMVDRGGCTFVTKVRNAQRNGAAAVIIADDTCLCSAGDSCTPEKGVECEDTEPIMADDGSGSDISVPSFLMFKQDADKVKETLKDNTMVQMQMSWALPAPDDRVEYTLWSTPTEIVSRDFERQFKHAAKALGDKAYFTPHMYIYDGIKSNCQGKNGENECYNLCTNNGRYCATDPDNDLDAGISGADVVVESLRRICIWKTYGAENGVGEEWWDYVNEFLYTCGNEEKFSDEKCVEEVYSKSGIDGKKIGSCMSDSGGVTKDQINSILEEELLSKDKAGVVILPAIYVNGASLRGALEFPTVFNAVCSGYAAGTVPEVCRSCELCPDQLSCTMEGSCSSLEKANASVSTSTFASSMLGLSIVFIIIGLIMHKRSEDKVRHQVKGIIAEYMPLDEDSDMPTALDTELT